MEIILKGKITAAYQQGQLNKDWSKEPLPSIHSESQNQQANKFTGQANIKTGMLSQFQQSPKKGLSPALGARLGGRNTFRGKGRDSRSRSRSRERRGRSRSRSPRRSKHSRWDFVVERFENWFDFLRLFEATVNLNFFFFLVLVVIVKKTIINRWSSHRKKKVR